MALRITSLKITNVGCFKEIDLRFDGLLTIICGENGIGKTTILDAVAALFSFNSTALTRNANAPNGQIAYSISVPDAIPNEQSGSLRIERWLPDENRGGYVSGVQNLVPEFLYIRANRDLSYARLPAVGSDREKNTSQLANETVGGMKNDDLKGWFVNRFLFSKHSGSLSARQISNYTMAIDCISTLDPSVRFSTVDASTFNIMVATNDGVIPLEFLSSGFRATFYTILGIIKEVELRKIPVDARDFSGAIAIDEVDLHLHPAWQRQIARVLRSTFPKAQFIITTHSPHVIQAAESGEVIALVRDDAGRPTHNPLPSLPYGFQGWTVEEILEDVMGVTSTKSPLFEREMQSFEQALNDEDHRGAAEHLQTLENMLHPKSPLRKLLRLQAAPVLG